VLEICKVPKMNIQRVDYIVEFISVKVLVRPGATCTKLFSSHLRQCHAVSDDLEIFWIHKANLRQTRPVWTGLKIAVRHKLLTHYKKAKELYD
jgi:hypothetical protein